MLARLEDRARLIDRGVVKLRRRRYVVLDQMRAIFLEDPRPEDSQQDIVAETESLA
jgi:hypothetical protein